MSDISSLIPIELDGAGRPLFSVIDDALGSCDDNLDFRLQGELKGDFHRHCNKFKKSMGERIRELIALDTYGHDRIASLVASHVSVVGIGVQNEVGTDVPTTAA